MVAGWGSDRILVPCQSGVGPVSGCTRRQTRPRTGATLRVKSPRMIRSLRLGCLFFSIAASTAGGQSRIDCSASDSHILKQVVHYCVYLPADYDSSAAQPPLKRYPVLYFLHGLGDNEQTLFNSGGW